MPRDSQHMRQHRQLADGQQNLAHGGGWKVLPDGRVVLTVHADGQLGRDKLIDGLNHVSEAHDREPHDDHSPSDWGWGNARR